MNPTAMWDFFMYKMDRIDLDYSSFSFWSLIIDPETFSFDLSKSAL
ncbi:hypothetical protein [Chryseobacterium sp. T16E-39]|nr:hypothetical protein [Chryseobacterium sp. T16E-39]